MLVKRTGIQRLGDDAGSTLVVVMVIMLVLTIGGLALAAVVTNTTTGLVNSRGTAQSRAAADAGMAAAVVQARNAGAFCPTTAGYVPMTTLGASSRYQVDTSCDTIGEVVFTATGYGSDGGKTTTEVAYSYTGGTVEGEGADMVFFGNTTFSHQVLTNTLDQDLLSIVIPSGGFTCMAPIPANIIVQGMFQTQGNCTVDGSVVAGGIVNMTNGPDTVKGNVTSSGTGTSTVQGSIGGDVNTGGPVTFGWNGKTIGGSVVVNGDVKLGNAKINGSLTVPAAKSITVQSGQVLGTTTRPASVAPPVAPTFDAWYDYAYAASDWPGFTVRTLAASGSGPWTCSYFNSYPASGWFDLAGLTTPTVLDARACSTLSANSGMEPSVQLKADIVFLAKSYDLTKLTLDAATGTHHRVWWIVEDKTANGTPTCSGGAGSIGINHTVMGAGLTAMAYTPCVVNVQGNSTWTGSFYGGSFNYGGGLTFYGDPILVPGMTSVTTPGGGSETTPYVLGGRLSQRDVP